jgi:hypothetical protein
MLQIIITVIIVTGDGKSSVFYFWEEFITYVQTLSRLNLLGINTEFCIIVIFFLVDL